MVLDLMQFADHRHYQVNTLTKVMAHELMVHWSDAACRSQALTGEHTEVMTHELWSIDLMQLDNISDSR